MPNFVDNNTSLPANKTDLVPIPVSALATNYVAANDYNSLSQASQDIRTVVERQVSLMSYNADPTGTSDNSAAFAAAFAGMTDGGVLHLPGINSGTTAVYKITANVTVPKNITLSFDNALISITSGHTLTINSSIAAANQQIFESSNTTPVVINSAGDKIPVQWFCAVGDGATDDTLAIQQAINAISASSGAWGGVGGLSGTIFIPTGKYNISSTLTVTNTCFFTLAGENPGSQLWWTGTSSGTPMLYLVNDYFPTIKDLLFFGNYLYPPSCAIQLAEYLAIKTTPGSTHARLLNLHLYSNPLNADGPGLVDGILWKNVDFDGNNDVSHVEDVSLQGPFTNCFNIQGGNSLAHTFINIFCEDYTDNVWNTTLGAGGSFSSYGG